MPVVDRVLPLAQVARGPPGARGLDPRRQGAAAGAVNAVDTAGTLCVRDRLACSGCCAGATSAGCSPGRRCRRSATAWSWWRCRSRCCPLPGAGLGDVGRVLGARALALGLFVLVGGVWADRLPRHLTMLAQRRRPRAGAGRRGDPAADRHGDRRRAGRLRRRLRRGRGLLPARPARARAAGGRGGRGAGGERPARPQRQHRARRSAPPWPASWWPSPGPARPWPSTPRPSPSAPSPSPGCGRAPSRPAPRGAVPHRAAGRVAEVRSRTWVWSSIAFFGVYCGLVLPSLFVLGPAYAESDRGGAGLGRHLRRVRGRRRPRQPARPALAADAAGQRPGRPARGRRRCRRRSSSRRCRPGRSRRSRPSPASPSP